MLSERGGIDGTGEDHSVLALMTFCDLFNNCVGLTAAEQQSLFEAESPSAVATYLAVYALIARGLLNVCPR